MRALRVVSCHAANLDESMRQIVGYLQTLLGRPIEFANEIDWPERFAMLGAGEVDAAWICGAPYVRRMTAAPGRIELLAAPVWRGARYTGRPVYFADLIVRAASPIHTFADLRGARWVYNEPGSLSGYAAMLAYLAGRGQDASYFSGVCASGGHPRSLEIILRGGADVTVIDSVVLEQYLRAHPETSNQIRLLDSVGPLPSMPWVASQRPAEGTRTALRQALLQMSADARGATALQTTPLAGFSAIADRDYDPVRAVLQLCDIRGLAS